MSATNMMLEVNMQGFFNPPKHSWKNLRLQVGVIREITPSCEASLKSVSGINGIRKIAETKP